MVEGPTCEKCPTLLAMSILQLTEPGQRVGSIVILILLNIFEKLIDYLPGLSFLSSMLLGLGWFEVVELRLGSVLFSKLEVPFEASTIADILSFSMIFKFILRTWVRPKV